MSPDADATQEVRKLFEERVRLLRPGQSKFAEL
jgi:hypothetical protein